MNKEKFQQKIQIDENGCWIWQESRLSSGYGQAVRVDATERWKAGEPVQEGAHRVSYKLFNGEIPCGKLVRHLCDVKLCTNPDHLVIGTQKDNMRDCGMSKIALGRKRNLNGTFK